MAEAICLGFAGLKAFRLLPAELFLATKTVAGSQGLHNGFLVAGRWRGAAERPPWAGTFC